MKIADIRRTIDSCNWTRNDLSGHTRCEFLAADVPGRLLPKIEALRALAIAPRFAHEIESRDSAIEYALKMVQRWRDLHAQADGDPALLSDADLRAALDAARRHNYVTGGPTDPVRANRLGAEWARREEAAKAPPAPKARPTVSAPQLPEAGARVGTVCGPGEYPRNNPGTVLCHVTDRWGTHALVLMDKGGTQACHGLNSGPGIGWHALPTKPARA